MSHFNYVAELLNLGTCLLRPGYLQTWAQLGGDVSANRVHEFIKIFLRVYHNQKG